MKRLEIAVPNLNDSFSRVVLDNVQYLIRFTWNDTAQRWSFGLFTMQKEPLAQGIRMVPRFPLNLQITDDNFPSGVFGVYTDLENIGRQDFINGNAIFAYISAKQEALS
ncbi:MAG: hypothetical protein LBS84_03265 [Clostridiales bacterium]|jgi:hypothetical protein|nr:hypothetical protein [Clostridiales bacterium]